MPAYRYVLKESRKTVILGAPRDSEEMDTCVTIIREICIARGPQHFAILGGGGVLYDLPVHGGSQYFISFHGGSQWRSVLRESALKLRPPGGLKVKC